SIEMTDERERTKQMTCKVFELVIGIVIVITLYAGGHGEVHQQIAAGCLATAALVSGLLRKTKK
ncbi:unnamed protein product, partial [marine sediment metagenome]